MRAQNIDHTAVGPIQRAIAYVCQRSKLQTYVIGTCFNCMPFTYIENSSPGHFQTHLPLRNFDSRIEYLNDLLLLLPKRGEYNKVQIDR